LASKPIIECKPGVVSSRTSKPGQVPSSTAQRRPIRSRPHFYLLKIEFLTKKAILLQAWTGPEGSRRMRLPDFKTIGT
jgi:hypothetical protein